MSCPCGSGIELRDCCGPFLKALARPVTAEQLMRSRYTAHVLADVAYLERTLVHEAREAFDPQATKRWAEESKWKGLKILAKERGGAEDKTGVVEFVATYERNGRGIDHHEISQFRRTKEGDWQFVDGEAHEHPEGEGHHPHPAKPIPVSRETPKVGRNDACPCGSGKKFKKCCGGAS